MPDLITYETSSDSGTEKDDIQQIVPAELVNASIGPSQYDNKDFFGVRGLLKRCPSLDFCQEVIQMNKEKLDLVEVRKVGPPHVDCCNYEKLTRKIKVERKIDRLIIPSLMICYGFYYM